MARKLGSDLEQEPEVKRSKGAPPANAGNVTRETFLEAMNDINEAKQKLDAAREEWKRRRKRWKAEGVVLGKLDMVVKMTEWGREEVRSDFETGKRYAEWMGLPTGYQASLFEDMTDEEISVYEWEKRGYTAGLKGADPIPPEECPVEHHTHWLKGRMDGQITLAKAQGDKKKIAKAEKEHAEMMKRRQEADRRMAEAGLVDEPAAGDEDGDGGDEDGDEGEEPRAHH